MPTPALVAMSTPPARQRHLSLGGVEQHPSDALSLVTIGQIGMRVAILMWSRMSEHGRSEEACACDVHLRASRKGSSLKKSGTYPWAGAGATRYSGPTLCPYSPNFAFTRF